jgi:hypothetical protein
MSIRICDEMSRGGNYELSKISGNDFLQEVEMINTPGGFPPVVFIDEEF